MKKQSRQKETKSKKIGDKDTNLRERNKFISVSNYFSEEQFESFQDELRDVLDRRRKSDPELD